MSDERARALELNEKACEVLKELEAHEHIFCSSGAVTILANALRDERRRVWEEAAEIAGAHECGGPDDIICQHQNCSSIIEGMLLAKAQEAHG